jgi:type IV fimbrial biogenesis protein FimT
VEQKREKGQTGFSLIELVITIAILAILMKLSMPSYGAWIANQQIRAGADSIIGAIQMARMEAMKRNARVMFQLTDAANNTSDWRICPVALGGTTCDASQEVIQTRDSGDDSVNARVGVSTLQSSTASGSFATPLAIGGVPAGIIFDGRGRPLVAGFNNIARIDVLHSTLAATQQRRLAVTIGAAGSARMCDPQVPGPANPRACP